MRHGILLCTIGVLAAGPTHADPQAARVGRLPVLELPPPGIGTCVSDPVSPALKRDGIARLISLRSSDSSSHRLVSLGLDATGGAVMLMAMMGAHQGRRGESESVNVFFGTHGTVRGQRSAFTTGTPARLSDDRKLGLRPADTVAARRLAAALRQRCRV